MDNEVIEGQYRVGSHGLIYVLAPRAKVRDEVIHHAVTENGVIFAITVILAQKGKDFESPDFSDKCQYHTIASILEKWPKVLPSNWLHQLIV